MDSQVAAGGAASIPYTGADELLPSSLAGDYSQIGERFIRRLIAERRIDEIKLSRYVRMQRSVLDAFSDPAGPQAPGAR